MRNVKLLIFSHSLYCFKTPEFIRKIKWFKDEREGCVPATHSLDGGLKVQKTFLLHSKKTSIIESIKSQIRLSKNQSPRSIRIQTIKFCSHIKVPIIIFINETTHTQSQGSPISTQTSQHHLRLLPPSIVQFSPHPLWNLVSTGMLRAGITIHHYVLLLPHARVK